MTPSRLANLILEASSLTDLQERVRLQMEKERLLPRSLSDLMSLAQRPPADPGPPPSYNPQEVSQR